MPSMSRETFDSIVSLLEQDPIFKSKGRKPQRPVKFQFACFLMRFGTMGADARSAAHRMGIGFGTVFLYCRRVSKALRRLGIQYADWGGVERRRGTSESIEKDSGFPNCIGIIDGSLVQLSAEPNNSGGAFYSRKGFPAVCFFFLMAKDFIYAFLNRLPSRLSLTSCVDSSILSWAGPVLYQTYQCGSSHMFGSIA